MSVATILSEVFFTLIAAIALVGSAEAQPVPGGVPTLEARVETLMQATNTLQSQLSTLQGQVGATLQSQVTTLQGSDSSFRDALFEEIVSRLSGDDAFQTALDQETAARKAGDAALQAAIAASSAGFSIFKESPPGLVQGVPVTIGTIGPLPAGSYAIVATVAVANLEHNADWDCQLVRTDTGAVIGRTFEGTNRDSFFGTTRRNVTIPALVTLPENGIVNMTCETQSTLSSVEDLTIVATSVGTATVECVDTLACQ